jgi:hypothetical protein
MESAFDLNPMIEIVAEPIPTPEIPSPAKLATMIVSRLAAGAVSATVVSLIHQNTTTYSRGQAVQLYVGAAVVGAMVADKAADYVTTEVTPIFKAVENWLWIPVEEEKPVENFPQTPEFVALVNAIPKKQ